MVKFKDVWATPVIFTLVSESRIGWIEPMAVYTSRYAKRGALRRYRKGKDFGCSWMANTSFYLTGWTRSGLVGVRALSMSCWHLFMHLLRAGMYRWAQYLTNMLREVDWRGAQVCIFGWWSLSDSRAILDMSQQPRDTSHLTLVLMPGVTKLTSI